MSRLLSFGGVTLPIEQARVSLRTTMRQNLIELQDGSFDLDGNETHQKPFSLNWSAQVSSNMQADVDALKKISASGRHRLVQVMRDSTQRYTGAKVTDAEFPANVGEWQFLQPISMVFQINYPFWRAVADIAWAWGDGTLWGGGAVWGGNSDTKALTLENDTIVIDASAATAKIRAGKITVIPRAGSSCTWFGIVNMANNYVFTLEQPLTAFDQLNIDLLPRTVRLNGEDFYKAARWPDEQLEPMLLEPASQTLVVISSNLVGTIDFIYRWQHHYL